MKKKIINRKGVVEVVKGEEGKQYSGKKTPLPVRRSFLGTRIFYNCPKCGKVLEYTRKKHRYCCHYCGQMLNPDIFENMECAFLIVNDPDEAFYWAGQYEYFNGDTYAVDINKWRLISKEYPLILYFPFPEGKAYGRFMRKAAKEATILTSF